MEQLHPKWVLVLREKISMRYLFSLVPIEKGDGVSIFLTIHNACINHHVHDNHRRKGQSIGQTYQQFLLWQDIESNHLMFVGICIKPPTNGREITEWRVLLSKWVEMHVCLMCTMWLLDSKGIACISYWRNFHIKEANIIGNTCIIVHKHWHTNKHYVTPHYTTSYCLGWYA